MSSKTALPVPWLHIGKKYFEKQKNYSSYTVQIKSNQIQEIISCLSKAG